MGSERGFDTKRYISRQKAEVLRRMRRFDRLYLEFGGHLCYDGHASRVLPGYKPTAKIDLLKSLGNPAIIYCVNAEDLDSKKRLGDFKLDYWNQTLKDIGEMRKSGLNVAAVIITKYSGQSKAARFSETLRRKSLNVYTSPKIRNYLKGPGYAVKGYDSYPYVAVNSKLAVITGAAGGSGKMSVAMSQVYKEIQNGMNSGYAKFETFPVWNLPLKHPVNLAYEAATADLQDKNKIDPYHLKFYGKKAVNYNRDIENFAILRRIASRISHSTAPFGYHSPTDMGISMTKAGIISDKVCREAAIVEIRRRFEVYSREYAQGRESKKTLQRMRQIIRKID